MCSDSYKANIFLMTTLYLFACVSAECRLESVKLRPSKHVRGYPHQPFRKQCTKLLHVTGFTKYLPRATLRLPEFEFDSADCLRDLSRNGKSELELFRIFNGRRVWWYGDSLVLAYFMTFVCRTQLLFNVSALHVRTSPACKSNVAYGFLVQSEVVSFEVYYFKTQTRLLYLRRNMRKTAPNCLTSELFRDIRPKASDIFLLNLGAWFNFNTPARNMLVLENEIRRFFDYFKDLKQDFENPAFLWLESTAQHFPGRDYGNFNYLKHKDGNVICANQQRYKQIRPSPRVDELAPLKVGVVPLFNLTATIGALAHAGASRGDCTHFALYHGGVLDRIVDVTLLYINNFLQEKHQL